MNSIKNLKMAELMCIMKDVKDASLLLHTYNLVQRVDQVVRESRRFTINELSMKFPEVLRSALYSIVTEKLCYRKLCARWVPKIMTDNHKTIGMAAALSFYRPLHS